MHDAHGHYYDTHAEQLANRYAVKRFKAVPGSWLFLSENPAYAPVQIPKAEMSHPILGTYVGRL